MAMPSDDPDPLALKVEDYIEWMVDSNGLKTDLTGIDGLELTDNPTAYIKRKIYTLTGHAMLGYLGYAKGYKVIYQAAFDRKIFHTVFTALNECGHGWSREYGIAEDDFGEYVAIMLRRFSDTRFNDQIVRICREPVRKLADGERFIGPAKLALKYGVEPHGIIEGLKAAIAYDWSEDPQAVQVRKLKAEKGVEGVLREICGLEPGEELYRLILEAYR
jgi:mannitol-1-phosphate 5-dehydrogenase